MIKLQRYEPDPADDELKQFEERLRNKFIGVTQREEEDQDSDVEEPGAAYEADEFEAYKRRRLERDSVPV